MQSLTNFVQTLKRSIANLWDADHDVADKNIPVLVIRLSCLIAAYMILDKVLIKMGTLNLSIYYEPIIFLAFLKHLFSSWYAIGVLPILIFLGYYYKKLMVPWSFFALGKYLRAFILLAAFLLAWVFSTYDFNLYYNQAHHFDRIALLLFLPLIFWWPVFVLPFLILLMPVIGQFTTLIGFSWASPYLPIRVLILFNVLFILFIFSKKFLTKDFVFLAGCLFAAHYWASGWGKVNWDWIGFDQIYYLLPATYANGWLANLEVETIEALTKGMASMNGLMKIFVLTVEVGSLLFFWRRRAPIFFLGGWFLMHIGIFATSGICFWVWMLMDLGFLLLFLKKDVFSSLPIFTTPRLVISVVLIAGGVFWCKPVRLAWYDVPLSYTYRFEAITESGATFNLPPGFFAPYDYQFTLSSFAYLNPDTILGITWGSTGDATIAKWLMEAESIESIFEFEKSNGKVYYNGRRAAAFDAFLKKYILHWNQRFSKDTWASRLQAPRLLWTFPRSISSHNPDPIRRVSVVQVTSLYQNDQYSEIRQKRIREVIVPR